MNRRVEVIDALSGHERGITAKDGVGDVVGWNFDATSREREDAVVAGVVAALRDIFETGENPVKVPDPIDAACAMWGRDEFARGSYSNISRRGTGADYDAMARSVGAGSDLPRSRM